MKNLCIETLGIGVKHLESGIKYFDLKKNSKKRYSFKPQLENAFIIWEAQNFVPHPTYQFNQINPETIRSNKHWESFIEAEFRNSGEAHLSYLEYLELQEARKSSKKANYTAIFAILISILAFFISNYFQVQDSQNPDEVIIIDEGIQPDHQVIQPAEID